MLTMTSVEAQNRFGQLLDAAQREPIAITRHGRTVAFVGSAQDMAELTKARDKNANASEAPTGLDWMLQQPLQTGGEAGMSNVAVLQERVANLRADDDIKSQASQVLAAVGMTMSEAVRLFLYRVVAEQAYPLDLKVPNAATRAAMLEADELVTRRSL